MELTKALLIALQEAAAPDVSNVTLVSSDSILLTHASGAQLIVNALSLAAHIQGDPERLKAEARGALAALARMATASADNQKHDVHERVVPAIRPVSWLAAARAQTGRDMVETGLAIPFGLSLAITFAAEYDDKRVPLLDWSGLNDVEPAALLQRALANQLRMVEASTGNLSATDLHMGDGAFFLRSKNLQAASLILQPFAWKLITRFAPGPPKAVLGAVVGPDAIVFGPGDPDDLDLSSDTLRALLRGLRRSFGGQGDWGDDVFILADAGGLPRCVM